MLMLLFIPIFYVAACAYRYLQMFAPSNVVIARVRMSPPRWRTAALLLALAYGLIWATHYLSIAIHNGAPAWLNLVVLVMAWDAIKAGSLAITVLLVSISLAVRRLRRRFSRPLGPFPRRSVSDFPARRRRRVSSTVSHSGHKVGNALSPLPVPSAWRSR